VPRPTDERPPLREKERASKEEALFLSHPKTPRQSTAARMLIGADWVGLLTEVEEFDANNICIPAALGRVAHA
jgi:hypothetical protein